MPTPVILSTPFVDALSRSCLRFPCIYYMNLNLDMQTQDAHDLFTEICRNSDEYPQVQLRKQEPHEALFGERQYRSLQERESSLFDRAASVITFWETGRRNRKKPCDFFNLGT